MIILDFIFWIIEVMLFLYIFAEFIYSIRNLKYQKKWNERKAKIIKVDPAITRAELCEQYVMFCKKNSCKVDF
jgi:hypothetical protein